MTDPATRDPNGQQDPNEQSSAPSPYPNHTQSAAVNQSSSSSDSSSHSEEFPYQDSDTFSPTYGTGVKDESTQEGRMDRLDRSHTAASPVLTGGDIDANYEQAYAVGDEAVGGTAPTPDMDIVDKVARAVGVEKSDRNFLHAVDQLEQRDQRRWELEPKSAEDYDQRRVDEAD